MRSRKERGQNEKPWNVGRGSPSRIEGMSPGWREGEMGGSHRKYCPAFQRRCYRMEIKPGRCPFILAAGRFAETGHSGTYRMEMGRSKDAGW